VVLDEVAACPSLLCLVGLLDEEKPAPESEKPVVPCRGSLNNNKNATTSAEAAAQRHPAFAAREKFRPLTIFDACVVWLQSHSRVLKF